MKRNSPPYWIKHTHLFDPDEYECSRCGKRFRRKTAACPNCGIFLRREKDDLGWIDEEEELDMILEDD